LATSLWLVLAVAVLTRTWFAVDQARRLTPEVLSTVPFSNEAGSVAYSLSTGRGFSDLFRKGTGPTAWLAPAYPIFLSGVFRLFGPFTLHAFYAAVALNIIFSAAAAVPLYFAALRFGGVATALLSAWLWAVFPNAFVIPFEWIWDTCLSALLGAAILWATLALSGRRHLTAWVGYGLLWGLSLLTNPALGVLLPFLLFWLVFRERGASAQRFRRPILAMTVVLLCCLPWTVRNYGVFHRFIPLRSNFPFELWLGNNQVFDDQSRNVFARVTTYGEVRRYVQLGEMAFMDEKWDNAKTFIAAHPVLELRLTRDRIIAMWIGTAHPVRDFLATDSNLARLSLLANASVTLGVVSGLALLFLRKHSHVFPVFCFAVFFPCAYYVTHASLRYRHAADPALLLLTAVSCVSAFAYIRRKITRKVAAA
jgi:4-amino-4-deoxy-L-arabinose transferase-like glycosyltransferase